MKTALDRADGLRTGQERGAAAVLDQLDALATQLEGDAGAATGRDGDAPEIARGHDQGTSRAIALSRLRRSTVECTIVTTGRTDERAALAMSSLR